MMMTFAIGMAAINTGNNLLYLILAMMLSFIILSGILSEQTLRHLKIERTLPAHPFAGNPTPIAVHLRNGKRRFSSFSFLVQEGKQSDIESKPLYIYHLGPRKNLVLTSQILFHKRGLHHLKGIRFETTFPFGFFEKSLFSKNPDDVVVFPKLISLPDHIVTLLGGLGDSREVHLPGHGSNVRNLREYTPCDDARAIHWKASARQGGLLVKEFEHEEQQQLILSLYNFTAQPADDIKRAALEHAVSLAASLAHHWLMLGHSLELQTLSGGIPMGNGHAQLLDVFRFLAMIQPVEEPKPFEGPSGRRTSTSPANFLILPHHGQFPEDHMADFTQVITASDLRFDLYRGDHKAAI